MRERAYAKINLCLDVVGRREDGYHDLKMIMVPVDFYDVLTMEPAQELSLSMNRSYLPVNEKNTVIKAIRVMQELYGIKGTYACSLEKHIPTQAGLAGGSADAAAAIRMINRLEHLDLSVEEMIEAGRRVGADVPFCVVNKPAVVTGIGEKIEPFDCMDDFHILLVKPRKGVSTKSAFEGLDFSTIEHPDVEGMKNCLINRNYEGMVDRLGNSLEDISLKLVPQIRSVKEDLVALGFDGVLMSGSGSTVFGITRSPKVLREGSDVMKTNRYFVRRTRILNASR